MHTLPKSAVHGGMALLALGAFASGVLALRALGPWADPVWPGVLLIAWVAALLLGADLLLNKVHWRAGTGLNFARRDASPRRTAVKLLGLLGGFGFVALGYLTFPAYQDPLYRPFFQLLPYLALA